MCFDGKEKVSQSVHGMSASEVRARSAVIQRGRAMNRLYPGGVRLRVPQPEVVLAWAAAGVGLIGIASALTPELANRLDLVEGVLPPGVPAAARVVALAFGLA